MNPLIFGLCVVAVLSQIGIYGTVGMTIKCRRYGRSNSTIGLAHSGMDSNFIGWVLQFWGQKQTTTTPTPATAKPNACPSCKCGLTNTQHRIIGGIETKVNQYPWMAQLLSNGRFYCAASVINDRYVLTASHCVHGFTVEKIIVRVGDHDRSTTTETSIQEFRADRIISHGEYSTSNFDNDIALVKIRGIIRFQGLIRPVCLAEKGFTYAREMGIVTGWGATQESGSTSNKLLEVSVPIMTNNECRNTKYPARRITDNMMCAGYPQGGKDACQGDSGGPMHVVNATDKAHRIVGVVSWGEGCAVKNFPGVYARVNRYLTWINRHTPDACYCN